jgi:uncharacterized protein YfaS (alpha-2-macroglobulin family)
MSRKVFDTLDDIELTAVFRDPDTEELLDPATVTLTVRKPDDSTLTPSVANISPGTYRATVQPDEDEHGRWRYRWRGTGDVQATQERYFVVRKQTV